MLRRILARANPDFDSAYARVENWWLELDENNNVCRELAFDASGQPIAASPLGDNTGIFTDLGGAPNGWGAAVDPSEFERVWLRFEQEWATRTRGRRAV
ncbi:MAG: hypothetical protein KF796_07385 [Ramlibacter sp.]|nr:hypothetical protein [Ramlibacter sp.]